MGQSQREQEAEIEFWAAVLFCGLTPLPRIDLSTAETARAAIIALYDHSKEFERVVSLIDRLREHGRTVGFNGH